MEIKFKRDTTFRKTFFVPESFAHPAKMDSQLLIWIVEHYTKKGEVILDPMAGSGTMMLACTLARNVILVELEEKFCKMMRDNWEKVKMRPQLGSQMGNCQIIQGDARQLQGLLVDKCIFSPPHGDAYSIREGGQVNKEYVEKRQEALRKQGKHKLADSLKVEEYGSHNLNNIGNLPYGQIDKIVTSPPFKTGVQLPNKKPSVDAKITSTGKTRARGFSSFGNIAQVGSENPDSIGNFPYGNIDSIITSPPYEGSLEASSRHTKGGIPSRDKKLGQTGTYANFDEAEIDSIITSPPYEDTPIIGVSKGAYSPKRKSYNPDYDDITKEGYNRDNPNNIGNLKSQSYLEAMALVYSQCWKCLKPQGLMILVTKNFIRNKQIVRLDEDTIKLCEQAGFKFVERHYRKLSSQSFWRVIYRQKYPEAPVIDKEDILVFLK